MSPTDLLDRIAQRNTAMARKQRVMYAGLTFNIVLFLVLAFVFPMPMERVGCVLTAVGWACILRQLRRRRVGEETGEAMASAPSIDFYRSNLERQRDFAAGWPWFLAAIPGPVLLFVGVTQQFPDPFVEKIVYALFPVFIALVAATVVLQARRARHFQREIDEVTQLQREHRPLS
jgi:chromate transport protein ChrA